MKLNNNVVFFAGGGTGGHIYPGLAVADELKRLSKDSKLNIEVNWIGCSKGMDKKIVEKAIGPDGEPTINQFYGIPSGKLRRYFSLKNFSDLFRILGGFFSAFHILRKKKPAVLFSKGGFVSVPPCIAARILGIPVFTHECDFTLGLANRINFKSAKKMFVSYEETKNRLGKENQSRVIVTGNPVRPVFYSADKFRGLKFLKLDAEKIEKPVLLVLGGSSGARQINNLVFENIDFLCNNFIVVHQTGLINGDANKTSELAEKYGDSYKPYDFIYSEMPDVVASADLILSRAGANSIWEAAVLYKPMLLVPLCGTGTRGDQVDNAEFFVSKGAAEMLLGNDADSEHLISALKKMNDKTVLADYASKIKTMVQEKKPSEYIAEIILEEIKG